MITRSSVELSDISNTVRQKVRATLRCQRQRHKVLRPRLRSKITSWSGRFYTKMVKWSACRRFYFWTLEALWRGLLSSADNLQTTIKENQVSTINSAIRFELKAKAKTLDTKVKAPKPKPSTPIEGQVRTFWSLGKDRGLTSLMNSTLISVYIYYRQQVLQSRPLMRCYCLTSVKKCLLLSIHKVTNLVTPYINWPI